MARRLSGWLILLAAAVLLPGVALGARPADKLSVSRDYRLQAGVLHPFRVIVRLPHCSVFAGASAVRALSHSVPVDSELVEQFTPGTGCEPAAASPSPIHRGGQSRLLRSERSPPQV
ncbi:MAG: hypothetical protein IT158_04545 [Bryobacterales bacterium]|nr:hypothetical protein [Bryobacterales bacterium]